MCYANGTFVAFRPTASYFLLCSCCQLETNQTRISGRSPSHMGAPQKRSPHAPSPTHLRCHYWPMTSSLRLLYGCISERSRGRPIQAKLLPALFSRTVPSVYLFCVSARLHIQRQTELYYYYGGAPRPSFSFSFVREAHFLFMPIAVDEAFFVAVRFRFDLVLRSTGFSSRSSYSSRGARNLLFVMRFCFSTDFLAGSRLPAILLRNDEVIEERESLNYTSFFKIFSITLALN